MDSAARQRLRRPFAALPVGFRFHLVNTVMGAALPGQPTYTKIEPDGEGNNAASGEQRFRIRDTQEVELLE